MLSRLIDRAAVALIVNGGIVMLVGLVGGSTELLSESTPMWLAGIGCAAMYAGVVAHGARLLWLMDTPKGGRQ